MSSVAHDTLTFEQSINAPLSAVWDAFAEPTQRAVWGVPAGEAQVYDDSNFMVGGRDKYRCGPPETLGFHGLVDYVQIVPPSLIVHTDTVTAEDQVLAVALLTWQFDAHGDTTMIRLTDQVTSFVGADMIEGHRNGHAKALEQLRDFLERP
ncbi:uncharacterized protein YndB with AHSA1/START domain [Arthrobacter roseus]|nr:uncharacterized protein YndB with AHSA1/START domain [Arthrobacter roseus]